MRKVAVISGGTRGLGAKIAAAFKREGYEVHAIFKNSRPLNPLGSVHQFDISAGPFVFPSMDDVDELVVIHNASAAFQPSPFHLIETASLRDHLMVGPLGLLNLVQPAIKLSKKVGRLKIAAILTDAINSKPKGFTHYLAAKRATESLMDSLKDEYRGRNIDFIKFYPSYMETDLTKNWPADLKASMVHSKEDPSAVAENIFNALKLL